jgi:hypothetical protein
VFNLVKLLFQSFDILLIIFRNTGDWIFTWNDTMVLMNCTSIDAVDTKQLKLVLAV